MAKKIYVDKEECTSCNVCSDALPLYFRMDDDDLAESHNDGKNPNLADVPDKDEEEVQETIDDCPGECILWKE